MVKYVNICVVGHKFCPSLRPRSRREEVDGHCIETYLSLVVTLKNLVAALWHYVGVPKTGDATVPLPKVAGPRSTVKNVSSFSLNESYLADELHHQAESLFRRRLRSASSHELSVPRTRLSTYGDRAFPVAAVWIWNSLLQHVTSAPSLPVFCTRLKTYFFELCYS